MQRIISSLDKHNAKYKWYYLVRNMGSNDVLIIIIIIIIIIMYI